MDEPLLADQADSLTGPEAVLVEEAFAEYLGHWNRLVSTTNWEKGRIISQWRQRLIEAGAPQQAYSDEAWSRRVGNVSGQHVGRLRRVFEQFGEVYPQYSGLYWSHFQAVLDWPDAEMWLEGAVQSGWSVAQMRAQRWEATGGSPEEKSGQPEAATSEFDEDRDPSEPSAPDAIEGSSRLVEDPDFGDEGEGHSQAAPWEDMGDPSDRGEPGDQEPSATPVEPVRPFEHLAKLPDDLAEAFEAFKLAILAHKLTGWQEIPCEDVLATLDSLKQLALAPPAD